MITVILTNWVFWLMIAIPVAALVVAYFKTTRIHIGEIVAHAALTFVVMIGVYLGFYYGYYKIADTEYLTGGIQSFTYEEPWTELVHYTVEVFDGYTPSIGYKGQVTMVAHYHTEWRTRLDSHAAQYYWRSTFGTARVVSEIWARAEQKYGELKIGDSHGGQVSSGDGRTFTAAVTDAQPLVVTHDYDNYVRAMWFSHTNSEGEALLKEYSRHLLGYPQPIGGEFGQSRLPRVLVAPDVTNFVTNSEFFRSLDAGVDAAAQRFGGSKQINPLVYFTTCGSQKSFMKALDYKWHRGHKNDSITVVGVDAHGGVQWVDGIYWVRGSSYQTAVADLWKAATNFNAVSGAEMAVAIGGIIEKSWERKPMKDFEYLKKKMGLPVGAQAWIACIYFALTAGLAAFFVFNPIGKDGMK